MDRTTIVGAALELLNEVGLDGLTTRRLAAKLDVRSPALYWHFRNKQELVDEMARTVQAGQNLGPPQDGEPWRDWLARRARERRRVLMSYRDGARLVAGTSAGPEIAIAFDRELASMVRQGFTPVRAMRAITALGAFVTGFVMEEQARETRTEQPDIPAGSAPETPTLMAAIAEGGSPDAPAAFEDGLTLLLDGIEAGKPVPE
ncbi:TetR/AcrR family transcriptional regulator C-terminal domain-containing protein [Actinomadura sp. WMMB 499]|uniref:TetR/AcrR family transcriptional regulator C-terminal domain-containing protein n=1 Tax=Actinomadura sp. WMMB 499 TaxID=1219491 RepID=UPI0012486813|nr:TetR/AcrR family transcriptional regulator C-terminal domain-containing protein [Actinomadura sp. WMMB 499]QFG27104.1 TetR family transcriptional regulator [Actinomadura sp. WMMB 499]